MKQGIIRDSFGRHLNYLRISVTDRCNLNCLYCRRWDFSEYFPSSEILSYEEMLRVVRVGARLGISKVRVTGGEPFVRKDVDYFLEQLVRIDGIKDVSVTTNGVFLGEHLEKLRAAGIKRLNISLDSLKSDKYRLITGRDVFDRVWNNIMAAVGAGFEPVKVNVVVMRDTNDDEISDFAALTLELPIHVRFIEYMPSSRYHLDQSRQMLTPDIMARVEKHGSLVPDGGRRGSAPAEMFRFEGAKGKVGFISPISAHFCSSCNRLRLTADGKLRPCLFSDCFVDVKAPLRSGMTDRDIETILKLAAIKKPKGLVDDTNGAMMPGVMSAIGG